MKILVVDNLYRRYVPLMQQAVQHDATWLTVAPGDDAAIAREIADADIFVGSKLDAGLIRSANMLKLVVCCAAGTNGIAISALPNEVPVTNTYHHERSIAEYVIMVMIALSRGLLTADRALRQGAWRSVFFDSNRMPHRLLADQTVGLIGLGRTGTQVAQLARAFGMRVIAVKRTIDAGLIPSLVDDLRSVEDLPWLLSSSRFVVLCVPLNNETRSLLGESQLRLMKSDAFLINVARGEVVDEKALYFALLHKAIAGAALDVWYQYPKEMDGQQQPGNFPFETLENVIMTPHHSGQAEENFKARANDFAYNIKAFIEARPLINVVPR